MQYIVDKIEGEWLILEGDEDEFFQVPKTLIPEAREGDCVEICINEGETKKRRENVRRLLEELFEE